MFSLALEGLLITLRTPWGVTIDRQRFPQGTQRQQISGKHEFLIQPELVSKSGSWLWQSKLLSLMLQKGNPGQLGKMWPDTPTFSGVLNAYWLLSIHLRGQASHLPELSLWDRNSQVQWELDRTCGSHSGHSLRRMEMQEAVLHRTGVKQRWWKASVNDQQTRRGPAAACLQRQKSMLEEMPAGTTMGRSLAGGRSPKRRGLRAVNQPC